MIEIKVTPAMLKEASRKAKEMGEIRNSITRGEGNFCGFLGEEVVNSVFGGIIKNTKDYDLTYGGYKYDVKTKRCTSPPRAYYDCSIAAYNTSQRCDRYIFVRIQHDMKDLYLADPPEPYTELVTRAWILGWRDKEEYFRYARKLTKGDKDGDNGFIVKADCYNLRIDELMTVKDLIEDELSKIIYEEELEEWWDKKNSAFEDKTPSEILENSPERLFHMLYRLNSGVPS